MKKILFILIIVISAASVFAQSKPVTKKTIPASAPKMLIDGKDVDRLVFRLLDPKDIQNVQVGTITNSTPTINSILKPSAKPLDLQEFFTTYNIPEVNQNIIKVNGNLLKKKENFIASKSMIERVNLDKDATGHPSINIITVKEKK